MCRKVMSSDWNMFLFVVPKGELNASMKKDTCDKIVHSNKECALEQTRQYQMLSKCSVTARLLRVYSAKVC